MPKRPSKPCQTPGCPNTVAKGRYCEQCYSPEARKADKHWVNINYGRQWRKIRDRYIATHTWCEHPGCNQPAEEIDHIVPKRHGGSDYWDNLQARNPLSL